MKKILRIRKNENLSNSNSNENESNEKKVYILKIGQKILSIQAEE